MKYLSIDIETLGLNVEECDVIEMAAVLDDLSDPKPFDTLPKFQMYIYKPIYKGEPYAIAMHAKIFQKLADHAKGKLKEQINVTGPPGLYGEFENWVRKVYRVPKHEKLPLVTVAGKNFASFDKKFLDKHFREYSDESFPWRHRVLDPMMLYLKPEDEVPPDTEECLRRAGLPTDVAHTALADALSVVSLLRAHYLRTGKR